MKIFITGASDGVGKELAKQLVRQGQEVWGIARRTELLSELQKELGKEKFRFSVGDLGSEKTAEDVVLEMKKNNFLPDVAVLNAAIFLKDSGQDYRHDLFIQSYKVNVLGALIWVDKFLKEFLKRGSGKFIAISSVAAFRPNPKNISFSPTKAALSMAFRGLRLKYEKENLGFSNIYFGPIATNLVPSWANLGKPRYNFVLGKEKAAEKIIKVINEKAGDYWFPFFTTLIFRISLFLPDWFYVRITQYLKR